MKSAPQLHINIDGVPLPPNRIPISSHSMAYVQQEQAKAQSLLNQSRFSDVSSSPVELDYFKETKGSGNHSFYGLNKVVEEDFEDKKIQETGQTNFFGSDDFYLKLQRFPFTKTFAFALIFTSGGLAVAMQVLLSLSNSQNGFSNFLVRLSASDGGLGGHYVYTVGAVAMSLPFMAAYTWLDYEIKLIQPLLDLQKGGSRAEDCLLLNYTSQSNFIVPFVSLRRGHIFTLISSLVCLITLTISPVASSLFFLEKNLFLIGNVATNTLNTFGYDPSTDLILSMSAAAGYSLSRSIYQINPPNFFNEDGAITRFETPPAFLGSTGFLNRETISVKIFSNCLSATTNITGSSGSFDIAASTQNCSTIINSPFTSSSLFNVIPLRCLNESNDIRLQSVLWWTQNSSSQANVIICSPSVELNVVSTASSLSTGDMLTTTISKVLTSANPFLAAPFNSRPFNGIFFDTTETARLTGAQIEIINVFAKSVTVDGSNVLSTVSILYNDYLSAFASSAYFTPTTSSIMASYYDFQPRLKTAPIAAHTLTVAFVLLTIIGGLLLFFHARARNGISISYRLGTIASAAALLGPLASIFEEGDDIKTLLGEHKFSLKDGKIVIDEDEDLQKQIDDPNSTYSPLTPSFPPTLLRQRLRRASTANGGMAM